ncbi:MAG: methylated-DNA--[protein]-cysteine S-methyltransferase [Desulfosarcinaceae bacterium]|nr:methylated-DNA--[protein]-cysteine S-methyltransferase [Desulfosarcinaceae bacterium]
MYYDYFDTGLIGTLTLVGDASGLRRIEFEKQQRSVSPQSDWRKDPDLFGPVKAQLAAYFKGELRTFDLPLAPEGTAFQLRVWDALQAIPYGELRSYGAIAAAIDNPKAVRAVGGANARNPIPIVIPCHRVIGSDGRLTGFGGGLTTKRRLIELESAWRATAPAPSAGAD